MTEVRYDVTDRVAVITLDAPDRRNALSIPMSRELTEAALTAEADESVGAVVVTGGAHFCAGAVRSVLADAGPTRSRTSRTATSRPSIGPSPRWARSGCPPWPPSGGPRSAPA